MADPVRMRELAPDLDAALDDAALDPPMGAEDEVLARLEATLADELEEEEAPRSFEPASPEVPARPWLPRVAVVGALALAAAVVAIVVGKSTTPRQDVRPDPIANTERSAPEVPPPAPSAERPATAVPSALQVPSEHREPARAPSTLDPARARPAPNAPVRAPTQLPPEPTAKPEPAVASSPAPSPVASASADPLGGELSSVFEARALVRARNGPAALAKLADLDARVPSGAMREERDALRIEALVLSGDSFKAQSAAAAFAEAYPNSPLLPRVRKLAQDRAP